MGVATPARCRVFLLLAAVAAVVVVQPATIVARGQGMDKTVLCHIPPGNSANPQTIEVEVGNVAVAAHMAHGDSMGACDQEQARVTGGVFAFGTLQPVAGAGVTIDFPASGFAATTHADDGGLFTFEGLPVDGTFIVSANDPAMTASGSAQGSIDAGNLTASVLVVIDRPGPGSLSGTVLDAAGEPAGGALVTYVFPQTERTASATTDRLGRYIFSGVQADGTVIAIAFDPATTATVSASTVLISALPNVTLNLRLPAAPPIQPDLVNGDFNNGLTGWQSSGPTFLVPREDAFQSQASPASVAVAAMAAGGEVAITQNTCPVMQAAVISSAGSTNGVGQLSQSFVVPPGYGVLTGRIKFLSNEWPEYYGTQYNDTFLARLTTPSGVRVLANGNVNSSSWGGGLFGFNGQTLEINFSVDISGWVGRTLNLHFEVRDVADLLFDSGLAISDVRLVRTEQYVPAGGGTLTGDGSIGGQLGQGVRITFRNVNLLGTTIFVKDNSPFGETKQAIILPLTSMTFTFSRFGQEPMSWDFSVRTVSDAFVVTYQVESTWVPGMPPNPCY